MKKPFNLVASAVLTAFGVLLPMIFHVVGALGPVFLPMHVPVLVGGMFFGPRCGLCIGLITPVISSFLTGMPPLVPVLPVMVVELAVYGLVGGYLFRNRGVNIWLAIVAAMISGRLAATVMAQVLVTLFGLRIAPLSMVTGALLVGLPGIIIQLLTVPLVVRRLQGISVTKGRG